MAQPQSPNECSMLAKPHVNQQRPVMRQLELGMFLFFQSAGLVVVAAIWQRGARATSGARVRRCLLVGLVCLSSLCQGGGRSCRSTAAVEHYWWLPLLMLLASLACVPCCFTSLVMFLCWQLVFPHE